MKTIMTVLLLVGLALAGCTRVDPVPTDSTVDPVNTLLPAKGPSIFSRPDKEDASVLINTITVLRIDPTVSGAIIYVEGVATRQGVFNTRLRPIELNQLDEEGILTLELRGTYPEDATPVGTEFSRTVHEAHVLSRQELQKIRLIRVVGANNALESRRR